MVGYRANGKRDHLYETGLRCRPTSLGYNGSVSLGPSRAPATYIQYESLVRVHVLPHVGRIKLTAGHL